jgi:hypothetical protein
MAQDDEEPSRAAQDAAEEARRHVESSRPDRPRPEMDMVREELRRHDDLLAEDEADAGGREERADRDREAREERDRDREEGTGGEPDRG